MQDLNDCISYIIDKRNVYQGGRGGEDRRRFSDRPRV